MVSEAEMKEFFQRVVDQVAMLSTQAAQVETLRQQVSDLHNRVNEVEQRNNELNALLTESRETVTRLEEQVRSYDTALQAEREHVVALRDVNVARDARVTELETNLAAERDAHRISLSERDDARQVITEHADRLRVACDELERTTIDRNTWRNKAIDLEGENASLRQKYDRIMAVLNPPQPVVADVA